MALINFRFVELKCQLKTCQKFYYMLNFIVQLFSRIITRKKIFKSYVYDFNVFNKVADICCVRVL